jgi:2,4-dienoyl-CoA reductase-like NADH-dependent reductase (Old Yellow Enzyme family)
VYLLRDVEKFLRNAKVPAARFGRDAMGDPRFVFDLRNGREPRQRTVDRIHRFLENAS